MVDTTIITKPARNATDPSCKIRRSKTFGFICIVRSRSYSWWEKRLLYTFKKNSDLIPYDIERYQAATLLLDNELNPWTLTISLIFPILFGGAASRTCTILAGKGNALLSFSMIVDSGQYSLLDT
jgi:hypothetical protein